MTRWRGQIRILGPANKVVAESEWYEFECEPGETPETALERGWRSKGRPIPHRLAGYASLDLDSKDISLLPNIEVIPSPRARNIARTMSSGARRLLTELAASSRDASFETVLAAIGEQGPAASKELHKEGAIELAGDAVPTILPFGTEVLVVVNELEQPRRQ
jgi:hypothetical protein